MRKQSEYITTLGYLTKAKTSLQKANEYMKKLLELEDVNVDPLVQELGDIIFGLESLIRNLEQEL